MIDHDDGARTATTRRATSAGSSCRMGLLAWVLLSLATLPSFAERPRVYAIEGATVVAAPGQSEESATVVIRDGLIVAVGVDVEIPADAEVIDGKDRWVYPGLIDAWSDLGDSCSAERSPASGGAPGGAAGAAADRGNRRPTGAVHPLPRSKPEDRIRDRLIPFSGENLKSMERVRDLVQRVHDWFRDHGADLN